MVTTRAGSIHRAVGLGALLLAVCLSGCTGQGGTTSSPQQRVADAITRYRDGPAVTVTVDVEGESSQVGVRPPVTLRREPGALLRTVDGDCDSLASCEPIVFGTVPSTLSVVASTADARGTTEITQDGGPWSGWGGHGWHMVLNSDGAAVTTGVGCGSHCTFTTYTLSYEDRGGGTLPADPFVYVATLGIALLAGLLLWGLFTRRHRRVPAITAFLITLVVALVAAFGADLRLGSQCLLGCSDVERASRATVAHREALFLAGWAVANAVLLAGWSRHRFRRIYGGAMYAGDVALAVWIGLSGPSTIDLASVAAMLVAVLIAGATFVALIMRRIWE